MLNLLSRTEVYYYALTNDNYREQLDSFGIIEYIKDLRKL